MKSTAAAGGTFARASASLFPAPDRGARQNNILTLAFGILVVVLVVGGSLWIMNHLNKRMMWTAARAQIEP